MVYLRFSRSIASALSARWCAMDRFASCVLANGYGKWRKHWGKFGEVERGGKRPVAVEHHGRWLRAVQSWIRYRQTGRLRYGGRRRGVTGRHWLGPGWEYDDAGERKLDPRGAPQAHRPAPAPAPAPAPPAAPAAERVPVPKSDQLVPGPAGTYRGTIRIDYKLVVPLVGGSERCTGEMELVWDPDVSNDLSRRLLSCDWPLLSIWANLTMGD